MTYGSPQTPDSNITLTVNDLNAIEREEITLFASRNGSEIAKQTLGFIGTGVAVARKSGVIDGSGQCPYGETTGGRDHFFNREATGSVSLVCSAGEVPA